MNFSHTQVGHLRKLGYTEREARFLYIVAIHSGYFTQTQLCPFLASKSGRATRSFTSRLLSRKHARERKYQNNASMYHLAHRRIYQAIGRENLRNRRSHTFGFMKTRLAILDFMLSRLEEHVPGLVESGGSRPSALYATCCCGVECGFSFAASSFSCR